MKTFILCEKPSQAMDFVKGINNNFGENFDNKNGYFESNRYIICFARGHLVVPFMPEDYDEKYSNWIMDDLPIIPNPVKYKTANKEATDLFKIISKQINRKDVDKVIVATDAEREGELIARLIINHAGVDTTNKNMYRFWTSSALTTDEIAKGLKNLKPLSAYDRYYRAALARQRADYIVGLNSTRAATIKAKGLVSLGRVQTPVVNIIYMRDKEIENFKPEKYYEITATFIKDNIKYTGKLCDNNNKIITMNDQQEGIALIEYLHKTEYGIVVSVNKTLESQTPQKLYSISTIQKDASSKYGISANDVLNILQNLYDKKYSTYPRTDSEVLSEDMVELAEKTINKLKNSAIYGSLAEKSKINGNNKNVFNNSKLTDHHALIPTGITPSGLSKEEELIYNMICKRFIAVFYPDYEYEQTKVITQVDKYLFYTIGTTVKSMGWKEIYSDSKSETDKAVNILPSLANQDKVLINDFINTEKTTTPPSRYSDGSLIEAMSKAASFVNDEALKKVLKDAKGIGTPATKANIIETIISRGYVQRKGKQLWVTDAGKRLIENLSGEQILNPAYTAMWEQELEKIASGEVSSINNFMSNIENYTKHLVSSIAGKELGGIAKGRTPLQEGKVVGRCPECGSDVIVYQKSKGYSCSNKECDFVLWKNKLSYLGRKDILIADAKAILTAAYDGQPAKIDGLKSKTGKEYTGNVLLVKDDKFGWSLKLVINK